MTLLSAPTTNTAAITVTEGASNGYALLGSSFTFDVEPGQSVMIYGNDATPVIAAADAEIDLSGTGAETLDTHIILGT